MRPNNEALLARSDQLNAFTEALKFKCETQGCALVRMRNNDWCRVVYEVGNDAEGVSKGFRTMNWSKLWQLDGSSFHTSDFDLIEFEP